MRSGLVLLGWTMIVSPGLLATPPARAQTAAPAPSARAKATPEARPKAPTRQASPTAPATDAPEPMAEPAPGGINFPGSKPVKDLPPARDEQVVPASIAEPPAETGEGGSPGLPGATPRPGGTDPGGSKGTDAADPFVLRPERLPTGKQQVKLSVEVRASAVINLGKETSVRIVVNNDGTADAYGVSVVYQLPESLQFVSSEVDPIKDPVNPQLYTWNKSMIAAGGEWSIGLKVVAKDTKACEHVASVTAKAGSKAETMVQEPKLKVEAIASPGRILKGGQIKFEITVSNPGTGPARNVNVQAKLTDGLKLGEDDLVEQTIDVIKPGEVVQLDPLMVDTVAGGKQTCTIEVHSPDVNVVAADHRIARDVEVTKPELDVKLTGQEFRYTQQSNEYKVTVTNTGTAAAKGVLVSASLPQQGGKLARGPLPPGATFVLKDRKLFWKVGQLDPGQVFESKFNYDTSTPGLYKCSVEATSGELRTSRQMVTDVQGMADLDLKVTQTDRVIDVGKTTYYDFVIKNVGTKEATKIQLSGTLVNLEVTKPYYEESTGQFSFDAKSAKDGGQPAQFLFPEVPRLAAGQSVTLSLEVKALRGGKASASVSLAHDEMGTDENARIKGAITTTVTDYNRPPPRGASSSP